jgi:two-component system phosphate regulon response regulator OmpR
MAKSPTAPPDNAPHLLVVDDDTRIRALLSRFLQDNGYRITMAEHAAEARQRLTAFAFDMIILDVMMPGEDGFSFARWLRDESDIPILMLTARSEVDDRLQGLGIGVDDYLVKPFDPRELLLRIASILRRIQQAPPVVVSGSVESVSFGPFLFHLARGELKREDDIVRITDRERDILRLLSEVPGGTVSREALAGHGGAANERTVDVQINRLRRKLERDPGNPLYLQTVRGFGYRLAVD